jgi:hypothetical protein
MCEIYTFRVKLSLTELEAEGKVSMSYMFKNSVAGFQLKFPVLLNPL